MPRSRLAVACATLCALLAAPTPAVARASGPGKLSTLNLFGPPSLLGIAGLLTRRAGAAAEEAGYTVQKADDAEAKLGRDTVKKLAQCELKVSCLVANSTPLGEGRLLVGTLDRDEVHYVVKLLLIDLGSGQAVAQAERSVLIASRQLDAQFDAMLPDLLAGKSSVPTRLTLTSPQKHVRLSVDDRPVGELPLTLELSPGRHELKASKPRFLPVERFVELEPGQTTTVELPLTLLPNQYDPDAPLATTTTTAPAPVPIVKESGGPGGLTVAASVAAGAAVVAAGVGTYFGLAEKSIADRAVDSGHDHALGITRAEALTAKQDATLANVGFSVAGAAAATAVVLFLAGMGDPGPAANPSTPKLGAVILPQGAAASLRVRF